MTCTRCGMYVYVGPKLSMAQLLGSEPITGTEENADGSAHVCPEPYPRETAEYLLHFYAGTGVLTTQTIRARIKLGLEG